MVQVQVRVQQVLYRKVVLLDVAGESLLLLIARNARVNENRFARVVAQDKAVYAEGIEYKLLDMHGA